MSRDPHYPMDRLLNGIRGKRFTGPSLIEGDCPLGPHARARLVVDVKPAPTGNGWILLMHCHACGSGAYFGNALHAIDPSLSPDELQSDLARFMSGPTGRQQRAKPKRPPEQLPSEAEISRWQAVLDNHGETYLPWLGKARGLKRATIQDARLGLDRSEARITIPVWDEFGELTNVRRYSPSMNPKIRGLTGRSVDLYPAWLPPPPENRLASGSLILCEGEWDALIARQHGLWAMTGTGGKATWKPEWSSRLLGLGVRRVAVIYDAGDALPESARVARKLRDAGLHAQHFDLAQEGLADGEDLTDWFVTYELSADELQRVISRGWRRRGGW